jgi:hypothetical protein
MVDRVNKETIKNILDLDVNTIFLRHCCKMDEVWNGSCTQDNEDNAILKGLSLLHHS